MITSFIEGRARIRHDAFMDMDKVAMITGMLKDYPGILEVRANPLIGSLLVLYDPDVVGPEQLEQAQDMLNAFCGEEPSGSKSCDFSQILDRILPRKTERTLLNATLTLCLLGIFTSWRLHILAGTAFAALCLSHNARRSTR